MLERYRILDLSDDRGHLAGMVLAQLGAEVIAVEPPQGQRARRLGPFADGAPDPERSLTHWAYNRGKKSIVLDSEDPADPTGQLRALAAGADVVITSGPADAEDGLNVDLAALRAEFPHLVTASISAFGDDGPKADWAATDLICAAASGPMGITGDRDRAPVRLSLPQTWHYAASDALCGVLLALRERERSGLGQHVDISAQQSYIIATQYQMLYPFVDQVSTRRMSGGGEIGPLKLRLVYQALDGHVSLVFLVGPTVGPYNTRLFDWMDEEGMCPDEFRDVDWIGFGAQLVSNPDIPEVLNRGGDVINAFTSTKTKAELLQGALDRNLLLAPITTTSELLALEQLAERDYWRDIDGVTYPGGVASMGVTPLRTDVGPPRLGADNDAVLSEAGRPDAPTRQWARPAGEVAAGARRAPLDGLNVLDLTWAIAGPFSSRILGDFGADVIRIESEKKPCIMRGAGPHMNGEAGAENSLGYATINCSKRSLAIDLTDERSLPVMEELVAWADVLIESFSVGVIDRIGLGYEHLCTINPELIMVSTSLMGQTGPIRSISGFGNIGAAVAGFYPFGGWPDRPPCGPFGAYSDYISPRFTVAAVLAALDHRDRTGLGQHIDYSQMEGAVHLLAPALLDDAINGVEGTRIGNRDANMAPHGVYPVAGDDRWLAIACERNDHWRSLATVIGRPDLAELSLEERFDAHDELDAAISQWTRTVDGLDAEAQLQALAVPAHRVLYAPDVAADPQLLHRGAFRQASHDLWGKLWVEDTAIHLSATPGLARWAAPTFGEHLYPILTEVLGRSPDEAAELIGTGIFQ